MRTTIVGIVVAGAVALAGCGGSGTSVSSGSAPPASSAPAVAAESSTPAPVVSESSPPPSSVEAQEYGTVEELRQAYEAAGGVCLDWLQDDVVESAIESGSCGEDGVLMVFAGPAEAEAQAAFLQGLYEESGLDALFVYGGNWIANVDDAREVAQALGGTLVDSPAGADTSDASTPAAEEEVPVIESGTWLVGSEIQPGVYRVAGYYARLDADGEIIDNDGAYGEDDLTLLVVKRSDDMIEINGQALAVEYLPRYDPIENGARSGIYLVGKDIAPGRYRIKEPDYAYAARLDKNLEIIDNEGNAGNVVITIRPSDYAFAFTGEISPL